MSWRTLGAHVLDAYLDNTIVSGLDRGDLEAEQGASEHLLELYEQGLVRLFGSRLILEEIARAPEEHREGKEAIYRRLLAVQPMPEAEISGVFSARRPFVVPIVPHRDLEGLRRLLPDNEDARHIHQTALNEIPYFVTTDERTVLRLASAIHETCGVTVLRPSAFLEILERRTS